jgi:pimeloyl-ACP methyl ester carboxylesterase
MTTKTKMLLLPGLLCDRALWAAQIDALSDIADSEVGDLTQDETMDAMAQRVLASAPPRFALAGLSMGGYASFAIMRRAPERVERLALLDTSARPDTQEQTQARQDLIALAQRGKFKGVTPQLLPRWIYPPHMKDEALVQDVTEMTLRVGPEAFIRQQRAIMTRPDSRPGLSRITCKTLVLCGREDMATPVEAHREIAADIPDSRLTIIEHCGHLSTMEKPGEVNAALRAWLST